MNEIRNMTGRKSRTLSTTEGPIEATLTLTSGDPLVRINRKPSAWTHRQAWQEMRRAIADGRVRL